MGIFTRLHCTAMFFNLFGEAELYATILIAHGTHIFLGGTPEARRAEIRGRRPRTGEGFLGQLGGLGERCKLPQGDSGHSAPPSSWKTLLYTFQLFNSINHKFTTASNINNFCLGHDRPAHQSMTWVHSSHGSGRVQIFLIWWVGSNCVGHPGWYRMLCKM